MIPDSLFRPPQSPVFVLFRVLVSPFSKSRFFFLKVLFSSSPSSCLLSKSSPVLSKSSVISNPRSPPPKVLSHPLRPLPSSSKPKNSGTTRSRPAVRGGSFQNGTYQVRKFSLIIH